MGTVTRELTIASVRCGYQGITTFSTMCTFLVVINPFEDSQHESLGRLDGSNIGVEKDGLDASFLEGLECL